MTAGGGSHSARGCFGPPHPLSPRAQVYHGRYRGADVAIKKLNLSPTQAAPVLREFVSEVALLARLRHPNIVLFFGACTHPMLVVTEFCERGNLFNLLHSEVEMSWALRLRLAVDGARGLHFLHTATPPILHRQVGVGRGAVGWGWGGAAGG